MKEFDSSSSKVGKLLKASTTRKVKNAVNKIDLKGRSLFILGKQSKIRLKLKHFLEHQYFENMIYHLVAVNTFLLGLDMPSLSDPYQQNTIRLMTNIISCAFIAEAILKIIVQGFVFGKGTYLRESWNILDFLIVVSTIINWILTAFSTVNISYVRSLRALRSLRPLRMISRNEGG